MRNIIAGYATRLKKTGRWFPNGRRQHGH
jgi:ribosomal protein S17E